MKHLDLKVFPCQVAMATSMQVIEPVVDGTMGIGLFSTQDFGKSNKSLDYGSGSRVHAILNMWKLGMMGVLGL